MTVTKDEVGLHERLTPQLESVRVEMGILSKGKPDNPVNKFKIQHINQFLAEANILLGEAHVPLKGFVEFDESSLPTNSDVVMVLAQYLAGMNGANGP